MFIWADQLIYRPYAFWINGNLLYLLDQLCFFLACNINRLSLLHLTYWLLINLRDRLWSLGNSRIMRFSWNVISFFIESSWLTSLMLMSSLMRVMRASALHRFGSHTVARALNLGFSNVSAVLRTCVLGESFPISAHILLIHCCDMRSA